MGLGLAFTYIFNKETIQIGGKKTFDNTIIKYYTYSYLLFVFIHVLYYVDYNYFNVLKYYNSEMLNLISMELSCHIYTWFYILFYANYLFIIERKNYKYSYILCSIS